MFRILIDTDPGIDDALALFLALASPEVQVEAVTTVSGNVPVDMTTHNALTLLELAQRPDIVVARGSDRPLLRQPVIADYVHGQNGIGNGRPARPTKAKRRVCSLSHDPEDSTGSRRNNACCAWPVDEPCAGGTL